MSKQCARNKIEQYPLFLSISDLMEITGLGKNNCYSLIKIDGCPAFKPDGQSKYLIPRDSFFQWIDNLAKTSNGYSDLNRNFTS